MQGVINVLKPTGLTSSDVVVRVRGLLKAKYGVRLKVGHLGTLDPGASGVLPIAVGRATKLFDIMNEKHKLYRAAITFGKATDTLDSYGNIIMDSDFIPNMDEFMAIMREFIGTITQTPPIYSAININGKRAYQLAREGVNVELKERKITIYNITLVDRLDDYTYVIDIECSSGTYIRSLINDIAIRLNSSAYMSFLIRLRSGKFLINDSVTLQELDKDIPLIPIDNVLSEYPRYEIDKVYYGRLVNGVRLKLNDLPNGKFLVYIDGKLFGLGHNSKGMLIIDIRFMI